MSGKGPKRVISVGEVCTLDRALKLSVQDFVAFNWHSRYECHGTVGNTQAGLLGPGQITAKPDTAGADLQAKAPLQPLQHTDAVANLLATIPRKASQSQPC